MAKEQLYTPEGYQKLIEEREYLVKVRREETKNDVVTARSFGDLSENSEYDEARTEQGKVEARIKELNELIEHAVVIDESEIDESVVNIGSTVKVIQNGKEIEYSIVGSNEADPFEYKISDLSPIGKALIGAHEGKEVVVETPAGQVNLKVLAVSRTKD
ncbi:MAG: transcription elongation factor GreA [Clostridia bacterium]|nr:transcription elongation factor GreA [Clostridia bacterium]